MEEDDFDECMAGLDIPELSNQGPSSSKLDVPNKKIIEKLEAPVNSNQPPTTDPKSKGVVKANTIIVNSRQRGIKKNYEIRKD